MNKFLFVVIVIVLSFSAACASRQASKKATFTPVEVEYQQLERRIVTWSEAYVTMDGHVVKSKAVYCRHEPSGEPCSLEEYNEVSNVGK